MESAWFDKLAMRSRGKETPHPPFGPLLLQGEKGAGGCACFEGMGSRDKTLHSACTSTLGSGPRQALSARGKVKRAC